jgi:hypothetical protein
VGRDIGAFFLGRPDRGANVTGFAQELRDYRRHYGLSRAATAGMALHWPLFRLRYIEGYGPTRRATVARAILDRLRWYRFPHRVRRLHGGRLVVALPASGEDFSSFREVIMKRAYASPWPLGDVRSVLDLGANTGTALSYLAHATPATRMIAVEANPQLIRAPPAHRRRPCRSRWTCGISPSPQSGRARSASCSTRTTGTAGSGPAAACRSRAARSRRCSNRAAPRHPIC